MIAAIALGLALVFGAAAVSAAEDPALPAPPAQRPAVPPTPGARPDAPGDTRASLVHGLEFGAGFGWYDGDLGRADGQFLRYRLSRVYDFGVTLDVGRQQRFGETSVGGGAALTQSLPGDASVSVGWSSGTGDVLAPRYRFDASATRPFATVLVTLGYTRIQSKIENASDGYSLGLLRYLDHWIVGGHVRTDLGYPGRTVSTSAGVGATWYVWKKIYLGGGLDWGDVSYTVLPDRAEVDYRSLGGHLGFSRWFDERSGFNLRLDYGETSFYRAGGVSFSLFREF